MAAQKVDGLHTMSAKGATDLTGKEGYFVSLNAAGKFAIPSAPGASVLGVISEGKGTTLHSSINTLGNPILKAIAGSAIAIGDDIQVDGSGTASKGSTNPVGTALNAVVAGEWVEIATQVS